MTSGWHQSTVRLASKGRGFHLVTDEIERGVPEIRNYRVGICHLFLQHTSASLSINENCDPDVRRDMEDITNSIVPESRSYRHQAEGADDMPAHVKSSLFGCSLTIPIQSGQFALGTWQVRQASSGVDLPLYSILFY
jgi:secondary thiamine-phosphate synthase enzyme